MRSALILFLIFLTACGSNNESRPNDRGIYQRLSTDMEDVQSEELDYQMDYEVPQKEREQTEKPDTYENAEPEQPKPEQRAMQQTIPSEEQKEYNEPLLVPDVSKKLPFANFKERWNAVSELHMTDLYIQQINKTESVNGWIYESAFNKNTKLQLLVAQDYVQKLKMTSAVYTKDDIVQMLMGWSQIVNIMYMQNEIYDVDELFHELGIGPNGDLSNLKMEPIIYGDISFEAAYTNEGYTFQATYLNPTQ